MPKGSPSAAFAAEPPNGLLARFRGGIDRHKLDRVGDIAFRAICTIAALVAIAVMIAIAYQLVSRARPAIGHFGLGFIFHEIWEPNPPFERLGALTFIYGTAVTSAMAMLLAVPLGVSIGLFLSVVASSRVRSVIGPLVEMLAAIPTVILGFWGIVVLGPVLRSDVEPFLHETLGFLPIFDTPSQTGLGLFTAGLILTIMVVPIIAAISRDLFLTVPDELRDGATALGSTRWEVVRGVILPSTASGVVAASFLGLGRAIGEAIAVLQVIGGGNFIHGNFFETGATLASRIAEQGQGAPYRLQKASLFYLGVILLVLGLLSSLAARLIMKRFEVHSSSAR
jgi:phosphate transport system permease protein